MLGSARRLQARISGAPTPQFGVRVQTAFPRKPLVGRMENTLPLHSPTQTLNPPALAPPGGHYSHAVVAQGMVYVSGQLPIDTAGRKLVDAPFEVQAAQVLSNVELALAAAGAGKSQLVQVRVYVTDIGHWPAFNALYAEWLGPHRPARAVVPVPALHFGLLIEIEAVAAL